MGSNGSNAIDRLDSHGEYEKITDLLRELNLRVTLDKKVGTVVNI